MALDHNGCHEDMIAYLIAWNKDENWEMHFKGINVADILRFTLEDFVAILGQTMGRALFNRLQDEKCIILKKNCYFFSFRSPLSVPFFK